MIQLVSSNFKLNLSYSVAEFVNEGGGGVIITNTFKLIDCDDSTKDTHIKGFIGQLGNITPKPLNHPLGTPLIVLLKLNHIKYSIINNISIIKYCCESLHIIFSYNIIKSIGIVCWSTTRRQVSADQGIRRPAGPQADTHEGGQSVPSIYTEDRALILTYVQ